MKLVDLLFDRRCCIYDKHRDSGAVCTDCNEKIAALAVVRKRRLKIGERTVEVSYLFDYDNPVVQKLLFKLKRSSNRDLFKDAGKLYFKAVPEHFRGVVTNCPRGGKGVRNYGYDQVAVPCRIMCKESDGSLEYHRLVKRIGRSKEQKNLSLVQRKENTKNKFRIVKKDIPKNILIVDDVVTTGSTVKACILEILKCREDADIKVACLASRNTFSGK